ncbi:MAG: tRNA (adenine-N(6)-)-methyltransferase [Candidatus Gastranaerophilaceae bacterium]
MLNKNIISTGKNDECYTYKYAVEPLLEFIQPYKDMVIWCPFDDENSEFVKVFMENGYNVVFSHIKYGQDFYTYEPKKWDLMISNPPFTGKRQIFERALSFNKPFALLMTLDWLNDAALKQLFRDKELQLLMFEKRMTFKNNSNNKITFSSAYFCYNFLPKQIIISDFNTKQIKLNF